MKKIFLFIVMLLIPLCASAQWDLIKSGSSGKYALVTNDTVYYLLAAASLQADLTIDAGLVIDTTTWEFIKSNTSGKYIKVRNRVEYMGKPAGSVEATILYSINSSEGGSLFDADSMWVYLKANTTNDIGADSLTANNIVVDYGNFANWIWTPAIYSPNNTGAIKFIGTGQDTLGFYVESALQGYFDTTGKLVLNNLLINKLATIDSLNVTTIVTIGKTLDVTGTSTYGINTNKLQVDTLLEGDGENGISTNATFKPTGDDQCDLGSSALAWRDFYTNDAFIQDSLTAVTGVFSGNIKGDTLDIDVINANTIIDSSDYIAVYNANDSLLFKINGTDSNVYIRPSTLMGGNYGTQTQDTVLFQYNTRNISNKWRFDLSPKIDLGGNLGIMLTTSTGIRWDTVNAKSFMGQEGATTAPAYHFSGQFGSNTGMFYSVSNGYVGLSLAGTYKFTCGSTSTTFQTHVIPSAQNTYNLGVSIAQRWLNTYTQNIYADTIKSNYVPALLPFGEMYITANDTTDSETTYQLINGWTISDTNNHTFAGDTCLKFTTAGKYKLDASISFTHTENNATVEICVFVNNVEDASMECIRKIGTGGDKGNAGLTGLFDLVANGWITLKVKADTGTGNVIINNANVNVVKIR